MQTAFAQQIDRVERDFVRCRFDLDSGQVPADRGVFITTGRFSSEARDYVARIPSRIVLIDGPRLARLMIEYNVGAQERAFVLKRIDEDFFE